MKFLIPSALVLAASFAAHASCRGYEEKLDLRKKTPGIFRHLTISNQNNYGYCYAHAGTFLVDFLRLKKRPSATFSRSSVVWGTIAGTLFEKDTHEEGGQVCGVINALSEDRKTCVGGALNTEQYFELGIQFYRIAVGNFLGQYRRVNSKYAHAPIMPLSPQDLKQPGLLRGAKLEAYQRFLKVVEGTKTLLEGRGFQAGLAGKTYLFNLLYEQYKNDTYPDYLSGTFSKMLASKECANKFQAIDPLYCEDFSSDNSVNMVDKIDNELDNGMAVGISYCSSVLKRKTYSGQISYKYSDGSNKFYWSTKEDCGNHASVVIGRKSDSYGKCHYLIRNSWGTNASYAWETSEGDIWIEEEALKKNLLEVHSVE